MAIKRKSSKVLALVLAVIMMLSIIPASIFAAELDGQLHNGKAAISSDMSADQINKAIFDALVNDPEGKNYQDYEWEYYCTGYDHAWDPKETGTFKNDAWGSIFGFESQKKVAATWHTYQHKAICNAADGTYKVRIAGETEEVTLTKVSTCKINFDYDVTKGDVYANSNVVVGEKTGYSPKSGVILAVALKAGYAVESVKVNGKELTAKEDGTYEFVPVAETTVEVAFVEAGTFHDLVLPEVEGVSYKVNGFDAKGTVRVSNDVETTIEYITSGRVSIDKVLMNDVDKTADVAFADYNGTQKLVVAEDTTIDVKTVDTTLVMTGDTVIPVIADANGNWDTAQIRQAMIDTCVSKDSPIGHFDSAHFDVQYAYNTFNNYWADITYTGSKTFRERVAADKVVEIWFQYMGDEQYRPSVNEGKDDGVYVNVTVKDLPGATIAVRSGEKNFTLYEETAGVLGYEALRQAIYKAVIDEANSTPAGAISYDKVKFTYQILDGMGSSVGIGAGKYYDFEQGNLGADAAGTYRYLRKGGKFNICVEIPSTDTYYGTKVYFDVNVVKSGLPTAEISVKNDAPASLTLNREFDRSYNYAALKQDILDKVLEVKNLPDGVELTTDDITFTRWANGYVDASGFKFLDKCYVPFEGMKHPSLAAAYYQQIGEAGSGEYQIKVALNDGELYYGSELEFKIDIQIADDHTAQIVTNEGPFEFTLNENGIGTFDYDSLKQVIFANVIKEVKNVPADLTWEDFEYSYKLVDGIGGGFGSAGGFVPFEKTKDASDAAGTFKYLYKGGAFTIKVALADGDEFYGSEVTFEVTVNVNGLPKTEIVAQEGATVVLERLKNRDYDYASLKNDILALLTVKNLPDGITLTADDITFERWANGYVDATGFKQLEKRYVPFEGMKHPTLAAAYYQEIGEAGAGEYTVKVTLPNNSAYYGSSLEFNVNIDFNDAYTTKIALKQDYEKAFVLKYKNATEFDYDGLKKEIFEAIVDTENSTSNVTFDNAQFTYQIMDAMGTGTGIGAGDFYDFAQGWLGADAAGTYRYMYKGGTFTIKLYIPQGNGLYANSVEVRLDVYPYERKESKVVLDNTGFSMDYTNVATIKQFIYDNMIDRELSILPAGTTIDDFEFEYWTYNYTAGDILGIDPEWVPLEGRTHDSLAGSYYKPIGGGEWDIKVHYVGNTEWEPYYMPDGTYAHLTINKADVKASFKQNYIYVGDSLSSNIVNTDPVDNFTKYVFTIRTNTSLVESTDGVINVYREGIKETDISVLPSIMFQKAIGKSAVEVYTQGISREQLVTLVNSDVFAQYLAGKNLDASVVEAMKTEVANLPASIQWVWIYAGSPETPGTYRAIAATAHEQYNSGVAVSDFYVKYNSKGWKLQWAADTAGLGAIKAKNFDFRAIVTKDGVPQDATNVKYIYTGFRANFLFYASTTEPPREAGIYTQTAWTSIFGGRYCFPKTRTFTISIL